MHWSKVLVYNVGITIILFLLVDFIYNNFPSSKAYGAARTKPHHAFGYTLQKSQNMDITKTVHTTTKIKNCLYEDSFTPCRRKTRNHTYVVKRRICTDKNGFKVSCDNVDRDPSLSFDVVFIGDSVTQGIALSYEDTFVGMYDLAHPSLRVANMGTIGYSPTDYLRKISYYLDQGLKTKHVVVFIDINDISGEVKRHRKEKSRTETVKRHRKEKSRTETLKPISLIKKLKLFADKNFPITYDILRRTRHNTWDTFFPPNTRPPNTRRRMWPEADETKDIWPYTLNVNEKKYAPLGLHGAIERAVLKMQKLSDLLNQHGIKLSVGVYPIPHQLWADNKDSHQVRLWEKFCEQKCYTFINTYPAFFALKKEILIRDISVGPLDHMHFSRKGNEVIFEVLNKEFKID